MTNKLCLILICLASLTTTSCASPNKLQQHPAVTPPSKDLITYNKSISDLGEMAQAYGAKINITTRGIVDLTSGFSLTNSPLPRQTAKILSETIDKIGGGIKLTNKKHRWPRQIDDHIARAIISGAITRFEKRVYGTDGRGTANLAQLTIDLKLSAAMGSPPFQPLVASQSITFSNQGKNVSFSLAGNTFNLKGTTLNSRDNLTAIHLLIESGLIELLGRHLILPYWEAQAAADIQVDPFVIDTLTRRFTDMTATGRIYQFQRLLYLQGFNPPLNGTLDAQTRDALVKFDNTALNDSEPISLNAYKNLYLTLPVNKITIRRQKKLAELE